MVIIAMRLKSTFRPFASRLHKAIYGASSPLPVNIIRPMPTRIDDTSMLQKSTFSQSSSDHKLIVDRKGQSIQWNLMMQAKYSVREGQAPRTNTAFGHNEDDHQYRARIRSNVLKLIDEIRDNPETAFVVCQEAPIGKYMDYFQSLLVDNLPETWPVEHLYMDNTTWGVFTLINRKKISCEHVEHMDLTAGLEIKDIGERCRTVKICQAGEEDRFVTNVHLPHNSPEEACKGIVYRAIKHKMMQPGEKRGSHLICGDWNIQPCVLSNIIKQVFDDLKREEKSFDPEHPVSVSTTIYSSLGGHLKADNSKLSVDASLLIVFQPSDQNNYWFKFESFTEANLSFLVLIASTASIALFNQLDDEPDPDSGPQTVQETATSNTVDLNAVTETTGIKQRLREIKTPSDIAQDSYENKSKP